MFSVELLLDAATDAAVRRDWQALVDADLPSAGRHTGESNSPHVTVAARDAPRSLALSASALPLPLALGALLLFPGRAGRVVLARAVVVDDDLLRMHREVAAVVGPADHRRYENTEPGRWTPHVTLAPRMPLADLPRALEAVSHEPVAASAVALRVWDSVAKVVTPVD